MLIIRSNHNIFYYFTNYRGEIWRNQNLKPIFSLFLKNAFFAPIFQIWVGKIRFPPKKLKSDPPYCTLHCLKKSHTKIYFTGWEGVRKKPLGRTYVQMYIGTVRKKSKIYSLKKRLNRKTENEKMLSQNKFFFVCVP